ncbi:MAG TPA: glycosyltransferase family 1 protein [Anaeromyxobacteraceae bacterium]|nr:glycosyltransferase family 1 protein [Anaeromyxobacteraceae bacterium]
MEIGFDAKRAFHNATGLGNYARDVLRILVQHGPEHRYWAYTPAGGRQALSLDGDRLRIRTPAGILARALPAVWRQRWIVRDLHRDGIRLFHGLSHELPLGIERSGVAAVVTIHDLIFERFPELYSAVDRRIYAWKCRSAAERADLVIAVSDQTRQDLVDRYGLPPGKIRVVYQGCHPSMQAPLAPGALAEVARRLALPPRFVLSVGTVERRKNLLLAVRALADLPGVPLVVVGRETPYAREVRALVRERGMEERVRFLSGLPMPEIAALYRLATVLVYPSRFEGFGIPILEALFSGTPVVTTRGGCFAEAGGPGSAYVDPDDPEELRAVLGALWDDEARRARMREAGRAWAERFRDEAIARELLAAYAAVAAKG